VLLQNVSGAQTVTIPPGSTILVIVPANGPVSRVSANDSSSPTGS
jgi:hypothetical protein